MTLEEAIKHCEEKAKEIREQVNTHMVVDAEEIGDCIECAKEHEQLALWLKELKAFREGSIYMEQYEKGYSLGHIDGMLHGGWGKWIITEVQCPICFKYFEADCYSEGELNKCPNCGSQMKAVQKND